MNPFTTIIQVRTRTQEALRAAGIPATTSVVIRDRGPVLVVKCLGKDLPRVKALVPNSVETLKA